MSKRLVKRGAKLLAINTECKYATESINANKLYSNPEIYSFISQNKGDILYIPFASNTLGSALRTWNLAKKSGRKVNVLFALRWNMSLLTKMVLKASRCGVFTLSNDSYNYFKEELNGIEVTNYKTGVDTQKFVPVDDSKIVELRKKYNLPVDKTIVLHVGHLKHERNIDVFLNLNEKYHGLLVFSSVTEKDKELHDALKAKSNITIIEDYCENIEEIYQMSDIYLFPVVKMSNSIDIPLSVLEAAACNKKIIATKYKEIGYLKKAQGLKIVEANQLDNINDLIATMDMIDKVCTRDIALEYDWEIGLDNINMQY